MKGLVVTHIFHQLGGGWGGGGCTNVQSWKPFLLTWNNVDCHFLETCTGTSLSFFCYDPHIESRQESSQGWC